MNHTTDIHGIVIPVSWLNVCHPEGFDAYGYPSEFFKLDMERLGIIPKRKPAKVIDFKQYVEMKGDIDH